MSIMPFKPRVIASVVNPDGQKVEICERDRVAFDDRGYIYAPGAELPSPWATLWRLLREQMHGRRG